MAAQIRAGRRRRHLWAGGPIECGVWSHGSPSPNSGTTNPSPLSFDVCGVCSPDIRGAPGRGTRPPHLPFGLSPTYSSLHRTSAWESPLLVDCWEFSFWFGGQGLLSPWCSGSLLVVLGVRCRRIWGSSMQNMYSVPQRLSGMEIAPFNWPPFGPRTA